MAPRGSSVGVSSPIRAASHPAVARRLDFDQDESSLQETPALSGSGQRRGKRANVYDIPEDGSPVPQTSAVLEESFVQEEITANEDSVVINGFAEESSIAQIGNDTTIGGEAVEDLVDVEESEITPEPVKEPARRGRKRKSDALEPAHEDESSATKPRRRGATSAQAAEAQKKDKKPATTSRRSKRVSDLTDLEASAVDASIDVSADPVEETDNAPAQPKRRGRPARPKPEAAKEDPVPTKATKNTAPKTKADGSFKKPGMPTARLKEKPGPKSKDKPTAKSKGDARSADQAPEVTEVESGKYVDVHGHPISKKDMEQMSTTSVGSRYGRGRHLSVFRELEPEAVARVGRTGRHRVAPIDFWKNDRIAYDPTGSMTSIVKNQDTEPERKKQKTSSAKGRKRNLAVVEEEEVELDPWEEEEGVLVGNFRDYDPTKDVSTGDVIEDSKMRRFLVEQCHCLTILSRYRVGTERHTAPRCPRRFFPVRKAGRRRRLLQLGHYRPSCRPDETHEELSQDAHGVQRAIWHSGSQGARERVHCA
jgi:centromere protein C